MPHTQNESRIVVLDSELVQNTLERARSSSRLRTNLNFHRGDTDNPQRFLNAFVRGTYCAPHRHAAPPKSESFLVLQGQVAVILFNDDGHVTARHVLEGQRNFGIDLPAGIWHTVAPLTETAVCFEVKPGPYDPQTDKEFAPFAPREGDPAALAYLTELLRGL
jgi:cupin fold WbuC family metalloprotein